MDSDALLDADDLKKPDPLSLRAPTCGEGAKKKKKACKNWYGKVVKVQMFLFKCACKKDDK